MSFDQDGDELNLKEEEVLGSNPNEDDTDGDGLSDRVEVARGLNINNPDTDSDGLNDSYEALTLGTNPLNSMILMVMV